MRAAGQRGIALLIVLATFLVIIFLSNIILGNVTSHSRLTHHQVSRIQAYYAAQAGMNLAMENLRTGSWPAPNASSFYIQNLTDAQFPASIRSVNIAVANRSATATVGGNPVPGCNPCNPPAGVNVCICTVVNYTATNP